MSDKPGGITRTPDTAKVVVFTPRGRLSPRDRVLASHRLVEEAAKELDVGDPGSGIKSLVFAAANHLALTIGQDQARGFFEMIARLAGDTLPVEPEGDDAA